MTNILAEIFIHVVTVTNLVGTFTPATNGVTLNVIEERRQTNIVADLVYDGEDKQFTIKTVQGDLIRTRTEPKPIIPGPIWMNGLILTNGTFPMIPSTVNPSFLNVSRCASP